MTRQRPRRLRALLRGAGVVCALGMLVWTFRHTEFAHVTRLIERAGLPLLLAFLIQPLSLLIESYGWQAAFATLGRKLSLLGLYRVRLSTEALAQTLPLGVVFAESSKPFLLERHCGLDLQTSVTGMAVRKWLLVASQGPSVALFAILGFSAISAVSPRIIHAPGLGYALYGAAALLLALAAFGFMALSQGRLAARFHEFLLRLPFARLKKVLVQQGEGFSATDRALARFFGNGPAMAKPFSAYLVGWLLEVCETILFLRLLGVELDWTTLGAMEVALGFVRNVVFVLPAGIGVQDLGYVAFLHALGVPNALEVAAAFVLLKRSKELCWAALGYGLLALDLGEKSPLRPRLGLETP